MDLPIQHTAPLSNSIRVSVLAVGTLLPIAMLFLAATASTQAIAKDLRLLRIGHYYSQAVFGVALSAFLLRTTLTSTHIISLIGLCVGLFYAAVFAIVTNNIEDLEIDKISNPKRPLVTGEVDTTTYLNIGYVCLCIALLVSAMTHMVALACVATVSVIYYAYSCRPLRLKRIPILSKALLALNSLVVVVSGFQLTGASVTEFPLEWVWYFLFPVALAANFVDLKDIAGDAQNGIATWPVLLGERRAKLWIAVATVLSYAIPPWLLGIHWLFLASIPLLGLHLYFLFKKPFQEVFVFIIYLAGFIALDALLLFL
jgi:4-hydroxybenzoate polyprenyltransferase